MAILVNTGKLLLLDLMLHGQDGVFKVHLDKNAAPPAEARTVVLGDMVEATFAGYAALDFSTMGAPAINGANEGESDGPTFTWTEAGGPVTQTCKALYITALDHLGVRKLVFYALFAHPESVAVNGDTIEKIVNLFTDNLVP